MRLIPLHSVLSLVKQNVQTMIQLMHHNLALDPLFAVPDFFVVFVDVPGGAFAVEDLEEGLFDCFHGGFADVDWLTEDTLAGVSHGCGDAVLDLA